MGEHFKSIFHALAGRSSANTAEPQSQQRGGKCCDNGHSLWMNYSAADGYSCDRCKAVLPASSVLWSCRMCNFDLCNALRERNGNIENRANYDGRIRKHISRAYVENVD